MSDRQQDELPCTDYLYQFAQRAARGVGGMLAGCFMYQTVPTMLAVGVSSSLLHPGLGLMGDGKVQELTEGQTSNSPTNGWKPSVELPTTRTLKAMLAKRPP